MESRFSLSSHAVSRTSTVEEDLTHGLVVPGSSQMQRGLSFTRPCTRVYFREAQ